MDYLTLGTNMAAAMAALPPAGTVTGEQIWQEFFRVLALSGGIGYNVGDLRFTEESITLSASQPWFNLRSSDQVLSTANFPQEFIDSHRSVFSHVIDGTDSFSVSSWSGDGATVTITLATDSYTDAILAAINEAYNYYGGFKLGCVSISSPIGDLVAGDYTITGYSTGSRTISVSSAITGATGTGSLKIAPRRIAGSSTTAQWYQLTELGFMVGGGVLASGYPVRDQYQGHNLNIYDTTNNLRMYRATSADVGSGTFRLSTNTITSGWTIAAKEHISDGSNGTPRTGTYTRGPAFALNVYKFTGSYTA